MIDVMLIPYKGGINIQPDESAYTPLDTTLVLANRMSASPERDLISRSRDFRRDMVSTTIKQR